MKAAMMTALAPGAAGASGAAAAVASHGVATTLAGLKVTLVAIAAVGVGAGTVLFAVKHGALAGAPMHLAPVALPAVPSRATESPQPLELAPPPPVPPSEPSSPPPARLAPPRAAVVRSHVTASSPAPSSSRESRPVEDAPLESSLSAETELLSRAVAERSAGRNEAALSLLLEFHRSFPRGVLSTEARVVEVLTRCALQDIEGAQRVTRELSAAERGNPAVRRLERSCAPP
jgi:hypothetical protein